LIYPLKIVIFHSFLYVYQRVDGFQPVDLQKIGVSPAPKVFPMVLSGSHGEAMQAEQEPKVLVQQDLMGVSQRKYLPKT